MILGTDWIRTEQPARKAGDTTLTEGAPLRVERAIPIGPFSGHLPFIQEL
jgi:hypothetical protein